MNAVFSHPLARRMRSSLLPVLLFASGAACAAAPGSSITLTKGLAYGPGDMPQAGCELGAADVRGTGWVAANGASTYFGATPQIKASYGKPVRATALRANLNREALRQLAAVAVQDEQGAWRTLWSGSLSSPVIERCAQAWFVQHVEPAGAAIGAVRFEFRSAEGTVQVNQAGLLPAGR